MVYYSWKTLLKDSSIYISFSADGINWSSPEYLFTGLYPNLISEEGDLTAKRNFRMYYTPSLKSDGKRDICYVEFTLE
jgi:hypothetical protein